jgi:hypothetical protein
MDGTGMTPSRRDKDAREARTTDGRGWTRRGLRPQPRDAGMGIRPPRRAYFDAEKGSHGTENLGAVRRFCGIAVQRKAPRSLSWSAFLYHLRRDLTLATARAETRHTNTATNMAYLLENFGLASLPTSPADSVGSC